MITFNKNSKLQIATRLEEPFNPPQFNGTFTEDQFFDEWHAAQELIDRELRVKWNRDDYGDGDYTISVSASHSRGIAIVATSNLFLQDDLIKCLQSCLGRIAERYEIHLSIGEYGESGELFIQSDKVCGDCKPDILLQLGLTGET